MIGECVCRKPNQQSLPSRNKETQKLPTRNQSCLIYPVCPLADLGSRSDWGKSPTRPPEATYDHNILQLASVKVEKLGHPIQRRKGAFSFSYDRFRCSGRNYADHHSFPSRPERQPSTTVAQSDLFERKHMVIGHQRLAATARRFTLNAKSIRDSLLVSATPVTMIPM